MNGLHRAMQLSCAVLPITALESVLCNNIRLLLVARGSSLGVVHIQDRRLLASSPILHCQHIHGIVPLKLANRSDSTVKVHLLLYGGRQLVWATIDVVFSDQILSCVHITTVATSSTKDWILCCKSDVNTPNHAAFITAYNAIFRVKVDANTQSLTCTAISDELGSFLYSASLVQRSDNCYLAVSGTVFGHVLVWQCIFDHQRGSWITTLVVDFRGHNGSIFGVSISSPQVVNGEESVYVGSCSDDRMICVWKVTTTELEDAASGHATSDGFRRCHEALAKTYAHTSRIWSVELLPAQNASADDCLLVSTGEDGQCQAWLVSSKQETSNSRSIIESRYADRHHAGKNVWSRCCATKGDMSQVFTGGADSQIVTREFDSEGMANHASRHVRQSFQSVQAEVACEIPVSKKPIALKTYLSLRDGSILATTDAGHLLHGSHREAAGIGWSVVAWDSKSIHLAASPNLRSRYAFFFRQSDSILCGLEYEDLRVTEIGHVRQGRIAEAWMSESSTRLDAPTPHVCIATSYYNHNALELNWLHDEPTAVTRSATSYLSLPATFEVTSVYYDDDKQILICGSRAGALALYNTITPSADSGILQICQRHVHGQDTVSSILKLQDSKSCPEISFYLTTGRDGTYCVHKLDRSVEGRDQLTTVHQAVPSIGPQIEGAHLCSLPDGSQKILLHGFQSKNFVVWNETDQTQVMKVDCGGAHRSWTFRLHNDSAQGGTFIWTKVRALTVYSQEVSDHEILQYGGHGREIKALAIHQLASHKWLIATGSEDTDIRLFEYTRASSGGSSMKCVSVIRKHTTGLQALKFSSDGSTLISAAGMEELYAWQLSAVPVLGQGVVFACSLLSADPESDARIMGFDFCEYPEPSIDRSSSYLLVVALSSGKLKVVQLHAATPTTRARFEVKHQFDFGTICLTQVDLSYGVTQPSQSTMIVGATNGFVNHHNIAPLEASADTSMSPSQTASLTQHKIHQNSITALQVIPLTETHKLIVSGGDDNALAFTMTTSIASTDSAQSIFRTIIIPKAHAAALTALQVFRLQPQVSQLRELESDIGDNVGSTDKISYVIITAGNDQRLQLWRVHVDIEGLESAGATASETMDELEVEFCEEYYTNVADISEISVLHGVDDDGVDIYEEEGKSLVEVLVVGVGMEVLRLRKP